MYKIYHATGACSLAVKAALSLTGAEFEERIVNLGAGEHLTEDYKRIHPLSKVPALDTGDFILTEGMAMHLHLADRFPDAGLFPKEGRERDEAFRWMAFIYSSIHPLFSLIFIPDRYGNDAAVTKQKAEAMLFDYMAVVDERLQSHNYLAGDKLTAADLYLMVQLHWQAPLEGNLLETFPNLVNYINRIFEHPKVGAVYQAEFGS
jgi:glutathione S-transferase